MKKCGIYFGIVFFIIAFYACCLHSPGSKRAKKYGYTATTKKEITKDQCKMLADHCRKLNACYGKPMNHESVQRTFQDLYDYVTKNIQDKEILVDVEKMRDFYEAWGIAFGGGNADDQAKYEKYFWMAYDSMKQTALQRCSKKLK